jgi:serine/threonine-protein kinase
MSDFLSKFSQENYKKKEEQPQEQQAPKEEKEPQEEPVKLQEEPVQAFENDPTIEVDPDFQKKKRRKLFLTAGSLLAALILVFVIYRQVNYVKVPDFTDKPISDARKWGAENQIQLDIAQEYDFDKEINTVIWQKTTQKIKKRSTLPIKISLGPNPKDKIELPDFQAMNEEAAQTWIAQNKAENVSIIANYNEEVEKGKFLKLEFANKELARENYTREDKLNLYYSKGVEPRKEDIEVVDFTRKPKAELEDWAKKNELKLEVEEVFSESVPMDSVVSQDFAKGKKIAKRDTFKARVSLGKPRVVPDFSQYTVTEASGLDTLVPTQVRSVFHDSVPYGAFISQSVDAGVTYKEGEEVAPIRVLYSAGRPFMKDLRNSNNEGDLQQIFYDEYQSKGADITYETYYVDSAQPKGNVVEMSVYGQYVSLDAHVRIGLSRGNLTATEPSSSENKQ